MQFIDNSIESLTAQYDHKWQCLIRGAILISWIKKKYLQHQCPHEWHIVSERKEFIGYSFHDVANIYCPLCEKVQEVTTHNAKRLIKQQEIRKQYADDFRI